MGVGSVRWYAMGALTLAVAVVRAEARADLPAAGAWPHTATESPSPVSPADPAVPAAQDASTQHPDDQLPLRWRMPEDAAARNSPFINGTLGSMSVGERFDSGAFLGTELGLFLAGRFRGSLRLLFPFGVDQPEDLNVPNREFHSIRSEKPALIWGAGAGVALYSGPGFVLSTTVNYMRPDVSDFGHIVALGLPFEWITRAGVRVGFEFGLAQTFGGRVLGKCGQRFSFGSQQADLSCDLGEIRAFDRDGDAGVWLNFLLGIPYERPEPELTRG